MTTTRELRAEIDVAAPPEIVWDALTDPRTLIAGSPELFAVVRLKPGVLFRTGQWFIGWNRRRFVVWPTRNVVVDVDPPRRLAWDTKDSGARWIFELEATADGTRVVQRRPVPRRLAPLGRVFAALFLGGGAGHADELDAALPRTLGHLKAVAESRAVPPKGQTLPAEG